LVHVTTVPLTLRFLSHQVAALRDAGWDVHCISAPGPLLEEFAKAQRVSVHAVPMVRDITPLEDLTALYRLWRTIRALHPDVVHAHTPKGGLLGMLAAFLARTPTRVYQMRGLPLMTASGLKRRLLRVAERVSCAVAHEVIAVGTSIRRSALAEGLCSSDKIKTLGGGSGQGVDAAERFNPERMGPQGAEVRRDLHIPPDALVVGFVGRLVGDKGIRELVQSWRELREEFANAYLLLVGPEEVRDALPESVLHVLRSDERVRLTGLVPDAGPYYAAMDVVAFPTYREGFPNVPLEAGAMGKALVVSDIPACVEAVIPGETAIVVPAKEVAGLTEAIRRYGTDPGLRAQHGEAARQFVVSNFCQERLTRAILEEYDLLNNRDAGSMAWTAHWYRRWGKRLFDMTSSAAALVALGVPLAAIAILVRLDSPGPAFFNQDRVGRGGRRFRLYKFRTMTHRKRRVTREIMPGHTEVTRVGALLRRLKLDEFPQILNVLIGDMSVVGPRPTIAEQLPGFTELAWKRLDVRPGLTGLAQISGNIHLTWPERWQYDAAYVDDITLKRDLGILAQTVVVIARGEERFVKRPPAKETKEKAP
jgi:lipopolysaccharide/colanic/teichoic acid biosynthesis glycosyltransferase